MSKIKFDGKIACYFRVGRISKEQRIENELVSTLERSKYAVTILNYPKPKFSKTTCNRAEFLVTTSQNNMHIYDLETLESLLKLKKPFQSDLNPYPFPQRKGFLFTPKVYTY